MYIQVIQLLEIEGAPEVADSGGPPVHGRWSGGASPPLTVYRILCDIIMRKYRKTSIQAVMMSRVLLDAGPIRGRKIFAKKLHCATLRRILVCKKFKLSKQVSK